MSDRPDATTPATMPASTTLSPAPTARLDPCGFQPLLAAVLPAAFGYALRLTRNRADAEDLVQEASLRAFRASGSFEPGTNFKAWFFRILIRCFWAKHRQQQRRPALVEIEDAPVLYLFQRSAEAGLSWDGDDPASGLIDRLGTERVAQAIAQLPEEFEEVCALYFMEDFSYQEIAEVIGCPVGTVRSRLHRGRKLLQKALWQVAQDAGIIAELARTHDEQDEPEEMP